MISVETEEEVERILLLLSDGLPLPYSIGRWFFAGRVFRVSPAVLIPRIETEAVLQCALSHLRRDFAGATNVLELGTGSGILAVSLALEVDSIRVTATDLLDEALEIARENAGIHNVQDKMIFIRSDLFESVPESRYDMILCNPPYVSEEEMGLLDEEVIRYEPRGALFSALGKEHFYKEICSASIEGYLKEGGWICLELGYKMTDDVVAIFESTNRFHPIEIQKDLSGRDRVISARLR